MRVVQRLNPLRPSNGALAAFPAPNPLPHIILSRHLTDTVREVVNRADCLPGVCGFVRYGFGVYGKVLRLNRTINFWVQ